jgi:hypothetical protein
MTLVRTAPARIALLAEDSHPSIKNSYYRWQQNFDLSKRPLFYTRLLSTSYPITASEDEEPQESYSLEYVGEPFKQDCAREDEQMTWEVYESCILHFLQRRFLQYTNERQTPNRVKLPNLPGLKYQRLDVSQVPDIVVKFSDNQPFWGFALTINLTESLSYEEKVVPYAIE